MRSRFAPNLQYLYLELPLAERYAAAARDGFAAVEVGLPYEQSAREVAKQLADNGLFMIQIATPPAGGPNGPLLGAWPGRQAEYRECIRSALDYAAEIGARMLHAVPGGVPDDEDAIACMNTFAENLDFAAAQAAALGIDILLEPVARARFANYLYHSLDEGIRLIERVKRDNIKLCFDTYHVQTEEGEITANLERAFPYLGHVQVADVPGRHEPGTGAIDFRDFFGWLDRLGWTDAIACEYSPAGLTRDSFAWIDEI